MLASSRSQKGKYLENFVVDNFKKFDKYCCRDSGSGNGKYHKEDVRTSLPFHIECKNQEALSITAWWNQTLIGCPADKYPILIYKQRYERDPKVVMYLIDMIFFVGGSTVSPQRRDFTELITLSFSDLMSIIERSYNKL